MDFLTGAAGFGGAFIIMVLDSMGERTHSLTWIRFFLSLPAWRLLTVNKVICHVLWSLLLALPAVFEILLVVVSVFYGWAVIGVWCFWDTFEILSYTDDDEGAAMDTLANSFKTHFELLIGANWHKVMAGAIRLDGSFVAFYFV